MRKRFLALVLGGVVAAAVFCTSPFITVHADGDSEPFDVEGYAEWAESLEGEGVNGWNCGACTTDDHITSSTITVGNGTITVTVEPAYSDDESGQCCICITQTEEKMTSDTGYALGKNYEGENYYYSPNLASGTIDIPAQWSEWVDESNTVTFDNLPAGATYYVYVFVCDQHGGEHQLHRAKYLGVKTLPGGDSAGNASADSVSSGSSESAWTAYEKEVTGQVQTAEAGSTVVMDEGITTISNSMMKALLEKGDVSLRLEFTYEDKEYVIVIPAGAALDNDIPWYGPLYLAQQFGNRAGTDASGEGNYEVKSGDSLSKIAAAANMTLRELLAKNPQIKDPNKIYAGQKINR